MFPERLTREILKEAELTLGTAYEGQYLQSPVVIGGRFFKESWPRWYTEAQVPRFQQVIVSVDTAFTNTSCPVSIQVWGYKAPEAYLLQDITEKMTGEQTQFAIERVANQYTGCTLVIEQASNGYTIIDSLKNKYRVYPFIPGKFGGKEVRATSVSSMWWQGHVWLKDTPYYRTTFLNEFLEFPAGMKDRVDSASQALIYLTQLMPGNAELLHLGHN